MSTKYSDKNMIVKTYRFFVFMGIITAFTCFGLFAYGDDSDCKIGGPPDPITGADTCVQDVVCNSVDAQCIKFVFETSDGKSIQFCACTVDITMP